VLCSSAVVPCGDLQGSALCSAVRCGAVRCGAVRCSAVQGLAELFLLCALLFLAVTSPPPSSRGWRWGVGLLGRRWVVLGPPPRLVRCTAVCVPPHICVSLMYVRVYCGGSLQEAHGEAKLGAGA
jgi:hypothetical protein